MHFNAFKVLFWDRIHGFHPSAKAPQQNRSVTQQSRAHPSLGNHWELSLVKEAFTLTRLYPRHLLTPLIRHLPGCYSLTNLKTACSSHKGGFEVFFWSHGSLSAPDISSSVQAWLKCRHLVMSPLPCLLQPWSCLLASLLPASLLLPGCCQHCHVSYCLLPGPQLSPREAMVPHMPCLFQ